MILKQWISVDSVTTDIGYDRILPRKNRRPMSSIWCPESVPNFLKQPLLIIQLIFKGMMSESSWLFIRIIEG